MWATPPPIETNVGWRYAAECEEGRSPTAVLATSDEQMWLPANSTRLEAPKAQEGKALGKDLGRFWVGSGRL